MPRVPTDVPVHRGAVGAMGWQGDLMPPRISNYVYQGTGEDVMPEADLAEEERARKREVARMKREAKMRKRREEQIAHQERLRQERFDRQRQAVEAARVSQKPEPDNRPLAKVIPLFGSRPEPETPAPAPVRPSPAPWVASRPKGPSPGWKPPSGSDLEEWLDDPS